MTALSGAASPALPGFSPARLRPPRARSRPARPAAAARAGLMPWVPVGLSVGIGLWFALPAQPGVLFYGKLALLAVAVLIGTKRALALAEHGRITWQQADLLRLTGWAVLLIAAGLAVTGMRAARVEAPVLGWRYYGPVEGRVVEIDRSGATACGSRWIRFNCAICRPNARPQRSGCH